MDIRVGICRKNRREETHFENKCTEMSRLAMRTTPIAKNRIAKLGYVEAKSDLRGVWKMHRTKPRERKRPL